MDLCGYCVSFSAYVAVFGALCAEKVSSDCC